MTTTEHARGHFEVKLAPLQAGAGLGRMSIDKRFLGDLDATSEGEMLAAETSVQGSRVYVALERVTGALHGLRGSFLLRHSGVMVRGSPQLEVTVVPDSGTGELEGLAGRLEIVVADGRHGYDFTYTLERSP